MSALLELENVRLSYGEVEILSGLSLSLAQGEVLALLGPSGSGKSSAVRIALGLVAPSAGVVRIDDQVVSEARRILVPPEERGLGVVFQDLALWPHLTVQGNLEFMLAAQRVPRGERRHLVEEALRRVGLSGKKRRHPGELSGGEQQRVAVARALVSSPRAVLFDEPLSNLDVALKEELLELFRTLLGERKAAALYVTHDPREAARLSDRIAVLEQGSVVQEGHLEELRAGPKSPFIKCVLADLTRGNPAARRG